MQVAIRRAAAKMLRKLPDDRRTQILLRLNTIAANPNRQNIDVKPLAGSNDQFRLRVGDYRVIFSLDPVARVLNVDAVGTRGDVYKR
jgi:mRNA interferase RelE/StbE